MPAMSAVAGMKKTVKVGAVGCGWRGSGAIQDIFDAGKLLGVDIRFTAFADFFKDRAAKQCKKWGIDEKNAFGATVMLIVGLPSRAIFKAMGQERSRKKSVHTV